MLITIMAEEERYSNRQIERLLDEQSKDIKSHIDLVTNPILTQVLKTNGRVTQNEKDITENKVWRGWMTGGMAVVMVILPIVVTVLGWIVMSIISFDEKVHDAIQAALLEEQ